MAASLIGQLSPLSATARRLYGDAHARAYSFRRAPRASYFTGCARARGPLALRGKGASYSGGMVWHCNKLRDARFSMAGHGGNAACLRPPARRTFIPFNLMPFSGPGFYSATTISTPWRAWYRHPAPPWYGALAKKTIHAQTEGPFLVANRAAAGCRARLSLSPRWRLPPTYLRRTDASTLPCLPLVSLLAFSKEPRRLSTPSFFYGSNAMTQRLFGAKAIAQTGLAPLPAMSLRSGHFANAAPILRDKPAWKVL